MWNFRLLVIQSNGLGVSKTTLHIRNWWLSCRIDYKFATQETFIRKMVWLLILFCFIKHNKSIYFYHMLQNLDLKIQTFISVLPTKTPYNFEYFIAKLKYLAFYLYKEKATWPIRYNRASTNIIWKDSKNEKMAYKAIMLNYHL